jgi:hypothetical protein
VFKGKKENISGSGNIKINNQDSWTRNTRHVEV